MPEAELHILAGGGIADALDEIAARFERAHSQPIVLRYGTLPQLIDMARRGVPFDLAVVPRDVLEDAAVRSLIVPDSIRTVARVGIGVANAINTFDPEEVVIGGGAARAGELLLEPARRTAAAYVLPGLGSATTIRAARHGVRAGVLGAALLAVHELAGASQLEPVQVRS